jgi:hypothetical protein
MTSMQYTLTRMYFALMRMLGNGIYSVCTGYGDNEVCRSTIDGSGWSNYGLTYFEQATRYVKHKFTGVQPTRTLNLMPDYSVTLEVTNKGR